MFILVGLGNPGEKFKKTRHNFGFIILDEFREKAGFPDWEKSKKGNCLYTKKKISGREIKLIKPLTYMNSSGQSVGYAVKKHRLAPEDIFVIHDDIDLPLGEIKISQKRGAAGHKGVESIIREIKTKNFIRFRVGIRPEFGKPKNPKSFVLQKFNRNEEKIQEKVVRKAIEAIETALKEGTEKAQNAYNQ